jgi:hypothetical protein
LLSTPLDSSENALDHHLTPSHNTVPLPEGCLVPNAIFARKHLVDKSQSLPSHLPINRMPIAEIKANESVTDAESSRNHFRGPFTPQLGFDGGLDYRWTTSYRNTNIADRRQTQVAPIGVTPPPISEHMDGLNADPYTRAKRRGFHFGYNHTLDWFSSQHSNHDASTQGQTNARAVSPTLSQDSSSSPPYTRRRWRSPAQLGNIQFVTPNHPGVQTSVTNRKTTIVQVSPSPPILPAVRLTTSIADDLGHRLGAKPSSLSNTSTLVAEDFDNIGE